MILPTKHISIKKSLLGVGATLLSRLRQPTTISALWEDVKTNPAIGTYERFILALDALYAIEAIECVDGLLRRLQP